VAKRCGSSFIGTWLPRGTTMRRPVRNSAVHRFGNPSGSLCSPKMVSTGRSRSTVVSTDSICSNSAVDRLTSAMRAGGRCSAGGADPRIRSRIGYLPADLDVDPLWTARDLLDLQHEFQVLVRELVADGAPAFLSSHVLPEVEELADRVAILRRGRLVALSTVDEPRRSARTRIDLRLAGDVSAADLAVFAGVAEAPAADGTIHICVEAAEPVRDLGGGCRARRALAGHDIAVSGIQTCGSSRYGTSLVRGLPVWDVTDPAHPTEVGRLNNRLLHARHSRIGGAAPGRPGPHLRVRVGAHQRVPRQRLTHWAARPARARRLPAHRRQRLRGFTLAENRAAATVVDREPVQATETATSASPTP
jgi:hypothetical protein